MTVCIAAFAQLNGIVKQIVLVSDSKVAFGDFSADHGAVKYEYLGNGFLAMIAGNDIVYALPTIGRARARIVKDRVSSADETADILHEELWRSRNRVIEATILRKYGMTVEQFVAKGRKSFTDQEHYDICSRIDRQELSLTFLLAGFDHNSTPHLRIISASEPPHDYDSLGFAAIGTGAPAALASLSFATDHLEFSRYSDMVTSAYHLLAAKFMSESATDVGKDTFCFSMGVGTTHFIHNLAAFDTIRKSWLADGAPRQSKKTITILNDVLYESGKYMDLGVLERCFKYASAENKKLLQVIIDAKRRYRDETSNSDQPKLSTPQTSEDQP